MSVCVLINDIHKQQEQKELRTKQVGESLIKSAKTKKESTWRSADHVLSSDLAATLNAKQQNNARKCRLLGLRMIGGFVGSQNLFIFKSEGRYNYFRRLLEIITLWLVSNNEKKMKQKIRNKNISKITTYKLNRTHLSNV